MHALTPPETVLVLGAGSWGATLADLLVRKGSASRIWCHTEEDAQRFDRDRNLPGKLEGFTLSDKIQVGHELSPLLEGATTLLFAVPSRYMRSTARLVAAAAGPERVRRLRVVSASKGFERDTLKRMTEVLSEELGTPFPTALSGPTHAEEVSAGLPTTVVAAAQDSGTAESVQALFMTPRFRVYTSRDVLGVELGGALKNVVAIAAGAAIGMGFGDNTLAALVTRGLAEISRLGAAMGAEPATFSGLSGLGDLVVTCASRHSRNRRLGMALAKGARLEEALDQIGMEVEGVEMARSVKALAAKYGVEMPISAQVAETLFEGVPVQEAVTALMLRDPKPESHPL
jgi:glycerol-3-phosphate dehydrogenase (NAD(P)+)